MAIVSDSKCRSHDKFRAEHNEFQGSLEFTYQDALCYVPVYKQIERSVVQNEESQDKDEDQVSKFRINLQKLSEFSNRMVSNLDDWLFDDLTTRFKKNRYYDCI